MSLQLLYAGLAGDLVGILVIFVEGLLQRKAVIIVMMHATAAAIVTLTVVITAFIGGFEVPNLSAAPYATDCDIRENLICFCKVQNETQNLAED
jgi:hypothetical protein